MGEIVTRLGVEVLIFAKTCKLPQRSAFRMAKLGFSIPSDVG